MAGKNGFFSEEAMANLAREALEDLQKHGFSPIQLNLLKTSLRNGNVGEVFVLSGLLKTVLNEISPGASQKKLLQVYQGVEHCCYSLVALSCNLSDVEVWQHYRAAGYDSFDSYCLGALELSPVKIERLKLLRDHCLPRPGKAGPAQLFFWLFDAIDLMANSKGEDEIQ